MISKESSRVPAESGMFVPDYTRLVVSGTQNKISDKLISDQGLITNEK